MENLPTRCINPILKTCEYCTYGSIIYPDSVESYADVAGCIYETCCTLGFDKGRPEDEPTEEELKEFDEWLKNIKNKGLI